MIFIEDLKKILKKNKIYFFTGVPDSVLKPLTPIFEENTKNHILATNEGSATAIAAGHYLSTKKIACVYLQNSGLSNAINPLVSISHSKVYSIPMLILIGWRGAPRIKDEPQHMVKGQITKKLLNLLDIKYCIIKSKKDLTKLNNLIKFSEKNSKPVACLIDNKTLKSKKFYQIKLKNISSLKRIDILKEIVGNCKPNTNIIATTGFTSRELMHIRNDKKYKKNGNDFYMVGGMGHSNSLSLGVSLFTKKPTLCIDGDGSLLMHLGSIITSGIFGKNNFKHILLNNNSHESVGGQSTNAIKINFEKLSQSVGYKKFFLIKNKKNLSKKLKFFFKVKGPAFMEIKIKIGSIKNLMRAKNLINIKNKFMSNIEKSRK
jgi:phosphonopyruvate decarboxylase|tara:strand:+ start:1626 stop:2750 length:1125 start_codon:yes stop_codon:yes gene_type:complete